MNEFLTGKDIMATFEWEGENAALMMISDVDIENKELGNLLTQFQEIKVKIINKLSELFPDEEWVQGRKRDWENEKSFYGI